jgi:hypothetical protein
VEYARETGGGFDWGGGEGELKLAEARKGGMRSILAFDGNSLSTGLSCGLLRMKDDLHLFTEVAR